MRFKASNPRVMCDFAGHMTLCVDVDRESANDVRSAYDDIKDKPLSVEVKQWRNKRSYEANSYLWVLCGRIAEAVGASAVEVYRRHIRDAGVLSSVTLAEDAAHELSRRWHTNGVGWFAESTKPFCGIVTVLLYYGSSSYDTAEMTRLIDSVIAEAKELGIDTLTPNERLNMLSRWETYNGGAG